MHYLSSRVRKLLATKRRRRQVDTFALSHEITRRTRYATQLGFLNSFIRLFTCSTENRFFEPNRCATWMLRVVVLTECDGGNSSALHSLLSFRNTDTCTPVTHTHTYIERRVATYIGKERAVLGIQYSTPMYFHLLFNRTSLCTRPEWAVWGRRVFYLM